MAAPLHAELSQLEWYHEELVARFAGWRRVPLSSLAYPLPAIIVTPHQGIRIKQFQLLHILLAKGWQMQVGERAISLHLRASSKEVFGYPSNYWSSQQFKQRKLLSRLCVSRFMLPQIGHKPHPVPLLTSFHLSAGSLSWTFNHVLHPVLNRWAAWSWINLAVILNLRSSAALWLFAAGSAKLIEGIPEWITTLNEAAALLGQAGHYEEFAPLYHSTISSAQRDLRAANTPIQVEVGAVADGRKTRGVRFSILPQQA